MLFLLPLELENGEKTLECPKIPSCTCVLNFDHISNDKILNSASPSRSKKESLSHCGAWQLHVNIVQSAIYLESVALQCVRLLNPLVKL